MTFLRKFTHKSVQHGLPRCLIKQTRGKTIGIAFALICFVVPATLFAQEQNNEMPPPSFKEPKVVEAVPPTFPLSAARKGHEGWAKYSFEVSKAGSVKNIKLIDSSGLKAFESQGQKALAKWKYAPRMLNGEPVESGNYAVQLDFVLDNNERGVISPKFKKQLDEARSALDKGDLAKTKKLIKKLDNRGKRKQAESFYLALLQADYAAKISDTLLEERAFGRAFNYLTRDWQAQQKRTYAYERMFKLQIKSQQFKSAAYMYSAIEKNSGDQTLIDEMKSLALQVDDVLENSDRLIRPGRIFGQHYWYHKLTHHSFSIADLKGDIDELLVRCDLKSKKMSFKVDETFAIPKAWGDCSVLVKGDKDSTFNFVEHRVL